MEIKSKPLRKILFVINPIAGDIDKEDLEERIRDLCQPLEIENTFFRTDGKQDQQKLKELLDQQPPDAVFAVGGDGTVNLVANLLNKTDIPLGIVPFGSGNGLSKDLNIPQDPDEALALVARHRVKAIDTLDINGRCSFHLTDLGFNALVVKRFSEGETRGPGAYAWIAMQEYLSYEPKKYRVVTDAENFEGPAFMVTITNAKAFGSNAAINPNAVMDDGRFEICLIEPFPKAAGLGILYNLYTDTIDRSVYTHRISCSQATVYNLDHEVAHVDGEPMDLGEEIRVKINPHSLRVILPENSAEED